MNSIWLKTKELFRFHFGCHDNQVTIAMRYVADAYLAKEPPYQGYVYTGSDMFRSVLDRIHYGTDPLFFMGPVRTGRVRFHMLSLSMVPDNRSDS